jgi:hypothetical protein
MKFSLTIFTIFLAFNVFSYENLTQAPKVIQKNLVYEWDENSPWFYDLDGNGVIDINQRVSDLSGRNLSVFFQSKIDNGSKWLLMPFRNASTYKDFCPRLINYYSSNTVFNALYKVIKVPTEGLYLTTNRAGEKLLLPESIISRIWFVRDSNGDLKTPISIQDFNGREIMFFWPANGKNIFKKYRNQKLYRLVRIPGNTNFDGKLGCVPSKL